MFAKVKELREQRAKLVADARAILEKEQVSAEDEAKFDDLMSQADKLKEEIDRLERLHDAEKDLQTRVEQRAGREDISTAEAEANMQAEEQAFGAWLRHGMSGLSDEQRQIVMARMNPLPDVRAAQSVGTDSAGGYLVPEGFVARLEQAMLAYGGMREVAFILRTSTGNDLPWPTVDDTSNAGAILSENTQVSEQDVTFGAVTINAYMYTSKLVRVSLQLLQDSAIDVSAYLADALGVRIARITNQHFTTGTGTAQPNGVVTAATLGKTGATGQTDSITFNDLVDLEHSVDPSYRRGAKFMMKDSTLKAIKKLVDDQSRPLWLPGIAFKEPDTILGYPYVVNQDMAAMAADAKSVLFGDFSKYLIRDVQGVHLLQLRERYADYLQVGFLAFSRHDGELIDAGTHPIKYYANSAT